VLLLLLLLLLRLLEVAVVTLTVEAQGARDTRCCCISAHCCGGAVDLLWSELVQRVVCTGWQQG
jgi:hypothetical protein